MYQSLEFLIFSDPVTIGYPGNPSLGDPVDEVLLSTVRSYNVCGMRLWCPGHLQLWTAAKEFGVGG